MIYKLNHGFMGGIMDIYKEVVNKFEKWMKRCDKIINEETVTKLKKKLKDIGVEEVIISNGRIYPYKINGVIVPYKKK